MITIWRGILWWGVGLPPPPTTETHARVTVGDKFGNVLTELDALVTVCAWRLNDYAKAQMVNANPRRAAIVHVVQVG